MVSPKLHPLGSHVNKLYCSRQLTLTLALASFTLIDKVFDRKCGLPEAAPAGKFLRILALWNKVF